MITRQRAQTPGQNRTYVSLTASCFQGIIFMLNYWIPGTLVEGATTEVRFIIGLWLKQWAESLPI